MLIYVIAEKIKDYYGDESATLINTTISAIRQPPQRKTIQLLDKGDFVKVRTGN